MSLDKYFNPEFTLEKKLLFLLMTVVGIAFCVSLIYVGTKLTFLPSSSKRKHKLSSSEKKFLFFKNFHINIQLFIDMMISATSVMMFSCSFVIIDHVFSIVTSPASRYYGYEEFISLWQNGKDFLLLLLICLSCVANTLFDKFIIPLKMLTKDQKASIRMLGMFYTIILLLILNRVGDHQLYAPVMMYYLTLMIGRFVYFDASFIDFIHALKSALYHSPLLIMGMLVSGSLCIAGFKLGHFLDRNFLIMGVFYTHLFILGVLFVLHNSRLMYLLVKKPKEEHIEESYSYSDNDFDDYDDYDE